MTATQAARGETAEVVKVRRFVKSVVKVGQNSEVLRKARMHFWVCSICQTDLILAAAVGCNLTGHEFVTEGWANFVVGDASAQALQAAVLECLFQDEPIGSNADIAWDGESIFLQVHNIGPMLEEGSQVLVKWDDRIERPQLSKARASWGVVDPQGTVQVKIGETESAETVALIRLDLDFGYLIYEAPAV